MRLGDAVKRATDAMGIPQCEECKRRQQWLNSLGASIGKALGLSQEKQNGGVESKTDRDGVH